jgi:hypothetical protein
LPTTVFLDDEGRVVEVAFGEVSRARLRAALARIVSPGPGEGGVGGRRGRRAGGPFGGRRGAAEEPGGGAVRTLGGSLAGG